VRKWLGELGETVVTFDRAEVEPGYVARCTLGVAIPLTAGVLLGHPAYGVSAAIGAFIAGFTSQQGVYRTRLGAVLAAALGMAVASFFASLAAGSTPGIVAATALAAYAAATIGQLGSIEATVSLNSFVAFVLFSSQPLSPASALLQSLLVFSGGALQALLLLLAWPSARLRVERSAFADVYDNLAEYARSIADGTPVLPPVTPFATVRQVLADPQPFARAGEMARLSRLLEDTEAIRKRLGSISAFDSPEVRSIARAAAQQLDGIAGSLAGRGQGTLEALPQTDALRLAGGDDLAIQLRDATQAAAMLSSGRLPRSYFLSVPRPGPYAERHVDWFARESIRFGIVLAVAMVAGRHFEADRGYWIPLTTAIVLRPDFHTTFVRGAARIAGTLAGAVIATAGIAIVRGHVDLQVAGTIVAAAAAYLAFRPNYALFTVAITSFVAMVLSMRGLPGTTTLEIRVLDTLAGGALGMAGYIALPSWERKRTRPLLADLIEAQGALAVAILRAYEDPSPKAREAIEAARTAVWQIRTTVEESVDRTRHEPHRAHTIGAGRALRILAATQRFALASLALETGLDTLSSPRGAEALRDFATALGARAKELAQALRESRRAGRADTLAAALSAMEAQTPDDDAERRFVLERLRAYREAVARLARLMPSA